MNRMPAFTMQQITSALDAKSAHLGPEDLARIAERREQVLAIIDEFPDSWAKAKRQATLLFELVSAGEEPASKIPLDARKTAAGALIYLSAPLDLVPDDEKDGYADDAAIVSLALSRVESVARELCAKSGKNAAEYFD